MVLVALGYELDPHVAAFSWPPVGIVVAAVVRPAHAPLSDVVYDPPPGYPGERLLTCLSDLNNETLDGIGLYHGTYNLLPGNCANPGPQSVPARPISTCGYSTYRAS